MTKNRIKMLIAFSMLAMRYIRVNVAVRSRVWKSRTHGSVRG